MAYDPRLLDPIDMSRNGLFNSVRILDKYKSFSDLSTQDLKQNYLCFMENDRKKSSKNNGDREIFYESCLRCSKTRTGESMAKIQYNSERYSAIINSLDGVPYSITFNDTNSKFSKVTIFPTEIIKLFKCISAVFGNTTECMCFDSPPEDEDLRNCVSHETEVDFWQGGNITSTMQISSSIRVRVSCNTFQIAQIHYHKNNQIVKTLGLPIQVVPMNKPHFCDIITMHRHYIRSFCFLLLKTNRVLRLQWEILAQQHAVASYVKNVLKPHIYSRQELYYAVLEAFYGLNATKRLPALYVLPEFLQAYLCENYSMYRQKERTCSHCEERHLKCTCDQCNGNVSRSLRLETLL